MSWAAEFNSGNMGNNLSSKMANIKLDTTVNQAEIQAKINEHFKPVGTSQNNSQTVQNNTAVQDVYTNLQLQPQVQTYTPYQNVAPNYQNIQYQQPIQYMQPNMQYYNYQQMPAYQPPQAGFSMPVTVPCQQPVYMQPNMQYYNYQQMPVYQPQQAYVPQQVETAYNAANTPDASFQNGQNLDTDTSKYIPNFNGSSEGSLENLQASYMNARMSQGVISKGIDGIKSLFSMKGTSKSAKKAIEKYQMGTITYNEAMNEVKKFSDKSKSSTTMLTSALSAIGGFVGAAAMKSKGGTTGKIIAAATVLGSGIKALAGLGERSTNSIKGDSLNAANIVKDLAQGAINGAITGGVGVLTSSSSKISSASQGSVTGAISGSAIGITDYSIDCLTDKEKSFSFNDMIIQSLKYAIGGAVIGAGTGALTGKIFKNNPEMQSTGAASAGNGANAAGAASGTKPVKTQSSAELTYENITKEMKTNASGHYTQTEVVDDCTQALGRAVKLENDSEITSLYEKFQKADTAQEKLSALDKMYKKLAHKYHPDVTTEQNAQSAWNLYSEIFGTKGNVGGKKALLYYYGNLVKQAAM